MRSRNGQSVLEYVLVLSAIIAIIILTATSMIRPAVNQMMNKVSNSITNAVSGLP